jgi:hypothetical protein
MLRWAFRANFTNCSRFAKQEISFHDMTVEKARNEMKSVTYVHAQSVTNVPAPCREGELPSNPSVTLLAAPKSDEGGSLSFSNPSNSI